VHVIGPERGLTQPGLVIVCGDSHTSTRRLRRRVAFRIAGSVDRRYDGRFVIGSIASGVYCRPSCSSAAPRRANARFYPIARSAFTRRGCFSSAGT